MSVQPWSMGNQDKHCVICATSGDDVQLVAYGNQRWYVMLCPACPSAAMRLPMARVGYIATVAMLQRGEMPRLKL